MNYAYDTSYLEDARRTLGEAFDYAVNTCQIDADVFMDLFITCGLAKQFGSGSPKYIARMSGPELGWEIVLRSGQTTDFPSIRIEYDYSPEYWAGWALAYYQWHTGRSFKEIKRYISMKELDKLYSTLHEASDGKLIDTLNIIIEQRTSLTHLQSQRRAMGYSQKLLAAKSGVSLRMIQQYEQRVKDINKASAANLSALSQTLSCRMEDLMEYDFYQTK